jgi:site-specific DNA-adenine methylase
MRNDFYFKYFGNKRNENSFLEFLLPYIEENIDVVVEPFGGSCSFSRWHFNIRTRPDIKYYVNDANKLLTTFCNNFQNNRDYIIQRAYEIDKEIKSSSDPKLEYRKSYDRLSDNNNYKCIEDHMAEYLYHQKTTAKGWKGYFFQGATLRNRCSFNKYLEIVKNTDIFFSKTHYHNQDYKIVLDLFKDNEKALIYLDPPYFNTDDSMYLGSDTGIEKIDHDEIMKDIYELFSNAKCKIIFVIKSDFMINTLFKKFLFTQYKKKYETSKNSCIHSVFINFDPMIIS